MVANDGLTMDANYWRHQAHFDTIDAQKVQRELEETMTCFWDARARGIHWGVDMMAYEARQLAIIRSLTDYATAAQRMANSYARAAR